ncbi:MAG: hypothetical protein HY293_06415 [Planctomycetes bacterium]|nr:hypothetical protein [Planctomycetota bacterium]
MISHVRLLVIIAAAGLILASGDPLRAQSAPPPITVTDLGTLGGSIGTTQVFGMNDLGMVVGYSRVGPEYHGYAWTLTDGFMDIGKLPGGTGSSANAVNNAGQVVGSADTGGYSHAVLWTKTGGLVDLGTGPGGTGAAARSINSKGQVAGDFDAADGRHAFFWSPASGMKDMGSLGGQFMTVSGMNTNGLIVGYANTAVGYTHGFSVKGPSGTIKDLGTLGGQSSIATAVNDNGVIAGHSQIASGAFHAFTFANNKFKDIATLGYNSYPTGINATGQVVGWIDLGGTLHAFSYTPAAGMIDIGTLGNGDSRATAVNKNGQVTGVSGTTTFRDHVFLWSAATGMLDEGSPDDLSSSGVAINASGQIAGTYVSNANETKGFFVDPTNGRSNIKDMGWSQSTAVAINTSGLVAGQSLNPAGYTRAFVWSANGGMSEIYTPTGHHSSVVGMNDNGQVIGHHNPANSYTQGFLWSASAGWQEINSGGYLTTLVAINRPGLILGYGIGGAFLRQTDGTLIPLPPPTGGVNVQPVAMNDSGVVIGTFQLNGEYRAFKWTLATGSVDLGAISAVAINSNGDYTGQKLFGSNTHAYLKKVNGTYKDLGAFVSQYSDAIAINSNAHVIGHSGAADGTHGFYYDTQMRDMGTLGGGFSLPTALNDAGQAVGWSYTASGQPNAFLWTKANGIRALTTLGGLTSKATAINGSGKAVGESLLPDESNHAVLWTTQ